jgi:hypothetical protein
VAAALDADSHTIAHTVPETGKPARAVKRTTAMRCRHCTDRVYRGWEAEPDWAQFMGLVCRAEMAVVLTTLLS